MRTIFLLIAALTGVSSAFEISQDTLESKLTGGESVCFYNRTPDTVRIGKIYVKRIIGQIGDGLIFTVSKSMEGSAVFSPWYRLRHQGDSLYVSPFDWNEIPVIAIPPRDSIYIKSVIYGYCLRCLSMSAPFNYIIDIFFVETGGATAKLTLLGDFVSGSVPKGHAPSGNSRESKGEYRIDGRALMPAGAAKDARDRARQRMYLPPR